MGVVQYAIAGAASAVSPARACGYSGCQLRHLFSRRPRYCAPIARGDTRDAVNFTYTDPDQDRQQKLAL